MSYGPPDPNAQPGQPGANYPQHLWPDYPEQAGQRPGGSPGEAKGSAVFAVAALVLGLVGFVAPLLPTNMDGFRQYAALPFAVLGLVSGIVGLIGPRRAQALAAIGAIVSFLALALGAYMVIAFNFS